MSDEQKRIRRSKKAVAKWMRTRSYRNQITWESALNDYDYGPNGPVKKKLEA